MQNNLQNKIAFITGASSGIGEQTAIKLAENKVNLILVARNKEKLEELAKKLEKNHGIETFICVLDVRQEKEVFRSVDSLPLKWQNIDILLNNAGLALGLDTLAEGDIKDYNDMIDTNVKGFMYISKAIVPLMIKHNKGDIIHIGSIAGDYAYAKGTVYCATKAFVELFTDGLRAELMATPIRVCNVKPGMVETNFSVVRFKGDKTKADGIYKTIQPLIAEDIANVIENILKYPPHVEIAEITVLPTNQVVGVAVTPPK